MRGGLIDVRCGDASELPWPDGRFDAVVSVEDVMLRNGLELALREVHRVLKNDGCVSIAVHERDWDPDFRARLTAALWNTDFVCVRSRRGWTLRGRTLFFTARAS